MIWLKKTAEFALNNNHSLTDSSAVDLVFECRSCQTKDYKLIFVAFTLRIRKMCLSGATCNHGLLLQWAATPIDRIVLVQSRHHHHLIEN